MLESSLGPLIPLERKALVQIYTKFILLNTFIMIKLSILMAEYASV